MRYIKSSALFCSKNIMLNDIITRFGLKPDEYHAEKFGSGLINHTYKVTGPHNYILQQVNTHVFKNPDDITHNLKLLSAYAEKHAPGYTFTAPLPCTNGQYLANTANGDCYRLFNFVEDSVTVNQVDNALQAYEAARQFGRFCRVFSSFNPGLLKYTIPRFHDLNLRCRQFNEAHKNAAPQKLAEARECIGMVKRHMNIVSTYNDVLKNGTVPLRVTHHDTKINNVLFDTRGRGLCVIDLDTVMPGYFFSDTGDMMRTFLSPVNEEETDLDKIHVRRDVYDAIREGYVSETAGILTPAERQLFSFSGKLMIYMQALRFLTDYLDNDRYYTVQYPGHNLKRAQNQLKLLSQYIAVTG